MPSIKNIVFHNNHLVTVEEFHKLAVSLMNDNTKGYYESGAEDEITLRDNIQAFTRILFRPRYLIDVRHIDTSCKILGHEVKLPFGFSPSAFHKLCHDDGEVATAKAAKEAGICMTLSTFSTCSLEEVSQACDSEGIRFFQLYMTSDRAEIASLLKRVKANGYKAVVLTADTQVLGLRIIDEHNKFKLPAHMSLANFNESKAMNAIHGDDTTGGGSLLHEYIDKSLDNALTWDDIGWIKGITGLPVVVKGLLTAEDAILAKHNGADAVWVSNHGGRQADGSLASIDALPEIVEALEGSNIEVYVDGGVRKGSDIFKALALGANHVFIGRPVLYGLTVGGQEGVSSIVTILHSELERMMKFAGTTNIHQITRNHIQYVK